MAAGHASRQGACTGWFPAVVTGSPVSVPIMPSSCENLVGGPGGKRIGVPPAEMAGTPSVLPGSGRTQTERVSQER